MDSGKLAELSRYTERMGGNQAQRSEWEGKPRFGIPPPPSAALWGTEFLALPPDFLTNLSPPRATGPDPEVRNVTPPPSA